MPDLVRLGGGDLRRFHFGDWLTIGSSPRCHVLIDQPGVLEEHAVIRADDSGGWTVRARGATFLGRSTPQGMDEVRVSGIMPIEPGQVLRVADQQLLFSRRANGAPASVRLLGDHAAPAGSWELGEEDFLCLAGGELVENVEMADLVVIRYGQVRVMSLRRRLVVVQASGRRLSVHPPQWHTLRSGDRLECASVRYELWRCAAPTPVPVKVHDVLRFVGRVVSAVVTPRLTPAAAEA